MPAAIYKQWTFDTISVSKNGKPICNGNGEITVHQDGRVFINIFLSAFIKFIHGSVSIIGSTQTGHTFTAEASLTRLNGGGTSFVTLIFRPLFIEILEPGASPSKWTTQTWHLKNAKFLTGPDTGKVGPFDITLSPRPLATGNEYEAGEINLTMDVAVTNPENIVDGPIDDVCRMLSLSQRCPIVPVIKEIKLGGKLLLTKINEQTWDYLTLQPLAEWYADDTLKFLNAIYSGFQANGPKYSVGILIDYYWRSHVETTCEIKFMYASVLMEALKFSWAANVSTTLEADINKSNGLIRGFRKKGGPSTGKGKYKNESFEAILTGACTDLGYPCTTGTFTFIDDRNCIFHSGLSSAAQTGTGGSWKIIKPELERLYNQIDDLLLRILSYNGPFFPIDFTSPGRKLSFPARTPIP